MIRAAAIQLDITPPTLPIEKPGWIVKILANQVDDPIFAKIIVLESAGVRVGFISLDLLSIRWPEVDRIRDLAAAAGIPKQNLMVAATHNHTGPAISSPGMATRDAAYVDWMIAKLGEGLKRAVDSLAPARLAIASGLEGRISFIRRCFMKDGTVKTHPAPTSAIRCPESVIDPEVGLLAVQNLDGKTLGLVVNFALHPTHRGGEAILSAGWPGQLSLAIKKAAGEHIVTCFLNGALGDSHHSPTIDPTYVDTRKKVGQTLAETILKMLPTLEFIEDATLHSSAETIRIPFRDLDGPYGINMKNRQRFAPDEIYEKLIERLRAKNAKREHVLAEIQCLRIGPAAFVSLPCEPFTGVGLDIKMRSSVQPTYVVGCANGMVGYIPTRIAFEHGGYETTVSMGNKLTPNAANLVTEAALRVIQAAQC